jgi:hypothetical protein
MNSDRDRRALQLAEKKARRARLEAELGTRQRALPDKDRPQRQGAEPRPWRCSRRFSLALSHTPVRNLILWLRPAP